MDDDYTDLLGSSSMPVRHDTANQLSLTKMFGMTIVGVVLGMVVYFVAVLGWNYYRTLREKSYKLSMRRRHGIPDTDHRPFNVAYAAALRARQGREKASPRQSLIDPRPVQQALHEQTLRQRPVEQSRSASETVPWPGSTRFPGQYASMSSIATSRPSLPAVESHPSRVTFADGLDTSASPIPHSQPTRRKSIGSVQPASKHQLEDEGYTTDNTKKTRIEGDELIDGDEDPAWLDVSSRASRSSKRVNVEDDGDEAVLSSRAREKRPRNNSDDSTLSDDDMMVDYQELTHQSPSTIRGMKRERVDSGSVLGLGDPLEGETKREKKRRNKRRSDVSPASSRGRKRDRDLEDELEEEADETSPQIARKKRGKRAQKEQQVDLSMDITPEKRHGREIGEEWESNGVQYRIGLNGERLRKAFVKKTSKVPMPTDSIHPDRDSAMDVFVEQWLTEDGYKEMRAQRRLPHQDTSPPKTEPSTPTSEVPESPLDAPRPGKHLLWETTSSARLSNLVDPFSASTPQTPMAPSVRRSAVTAVGLQPTAFPRRIASNLGPSISAPGSPGLGDSTSSLGIGSPRPLRGYSKWEKQDLEAKAMSKIREANQKRKEELDRLEQEKKDKLKATMPTLTAAPTVPAISITKPEDKAAAPSTSASAPLNLFAPPKSSPLALASAPALSGSEAPKTATNPLFSKPAAPAASPQPPATSTPAPSKPGGMPIFFPSSSSATPSSSTPTPVLKPAGGPNFSFNPSSQPAPQATEKPKAPASGLGMGFPSSTAPPAPATSASAAPKAAPSTMFNFSGGSQAKPANPTPPATTFSQPPSSAPGGSLASRLGPSTGSAAAPSQFSFSNAPSDKKTDTSGSQFKFAAPAAPAKAPEKPADIVKPTFDFTKYGKAAEKKESSHTEKDSSPAAASSSTAPANFSAPSFNFGGPTTAPSAFGAKSATGAPAPISFGTNAPASASSFGPPASTASPAATPAFGAKPNTAASSAPATSTSTPAAASPFGGGAPSTFGGFGATKTAAFGSGAPSTAMDGDQPKTDSNVFANNTTTKEGAFGSGSGPEGVKSSFGFGTSGPSAFGGGNKDGGKSAFGSGASTPGPSSTFGTSGVFGAAEKGKEAESKPAAFGSGGGFGSGSGGFGTSGAFGAKEGGQQTSAFGSTGSSAPSAFGTSSTGTSAFGSAPGKSTFGGFGNAGTSSAFGSTAAKPAETAAPAKSTFAFGDKPAGSPASTFNFGQPTSTPASTPFGAKPADGTAKPMFAFGDNSGTTPSSNPFGKTS